MQPIREAELARLFVIIGGFVVLLLTAALIAPLFINWTNYRADFEAQASIILGRPVKVAGDASARLLPFPSVTFNDVRVGDDPAKPVLMAEHFSMDAELAPFLSGEVLIFDMRVTKPKGVVTIDAEGVVDWTLRPQAPFDAAQIRVENLLIEDGSITIADTRAGRSHVVNGVQATVSARALTGPWRLNGTANFDGEPLALSVSTGSVSDQGELPLAMTVTPAERAFVVESDGTAKSVAGKLSWAGAFVLRQSRLTDRTKPVLKDGNGELMKAEAKAPAWTAKGKFSLAADRLDLPEIRLETGTKENPYISNGKGMVMFGPQPMFDLTLEGAQVTFGNEDDAQPEGADRLSAIRETLNAIPMPDMKGTVNFNLPALVAGDTTIRDIGFAATPEDGAWRLRGFHATLPGRTRVEADGLFGTGERFGFDGKLTMASNQPAGFSNWLTGSVDASIRNLKALGFSADVALRAESQNFKNLELAIDASVFKGAVERRTDGARPSIQAKLSGGALPLSALTALASGMMAPEGGSRFGGHDVALTLDAGPVSDGQIAAETLGLTVRLKQDRLDIDRLMIGNLAGATISATGVAENLRAAVKLQADASLVSNDAAPIADLLAGWLPQDGPARNVLARIASVPDLLKDMRANVIINTASEGGIRALTVSYTSRTAGGEQTLTGTITGEGMTFSPGDISATASVRENDPLKLMSLAGIPVLPMSIEGPAEVAVKVQGRLTDGLSVDASYGAGATKASWNGTIDESSGALTADGQIMIQSDDFDPYLQAGGLIFAGTGTGTPLSMNASMRTGGAAISLGGLSLKIADAFLSGDVKLDMAAARPKLTGSMKSQTVDGLLFVETLYGPAGLAGMDASFPGSALIPIDADVALSTNAIAFPPFGEANDLTAALTMDAFGIRLSGIEAKMANGTLIGSLEGRNDGGTATVNGEFVLSNAETAILTGHEMPGGVATLSGSFTGSGKSLDGLIAALAGSGVVKLEGGVIPGLNPDGFAPIAVLAQTIDKAPLAQQVTALVDGPVKSGAFPVTNAPMAWSLAGGKIKVPSMRSTSGSASLEAALEADLTEWRAVVAGVMSYDAGQAAVAGAEPQVPFRYLIDGEQALFETDPQPLMQFLTQAALEREQARVEAMQASLIEKQRLRRDERRIGALYTAARARSAAREVAVREAKARQAAIFLDQWKVEEERLAAEAKARQEAETAARKAAEDAEAKKAAAEAAKPKIPEITEPKVLPQLPIPQPDPANDDTLKWLKLKLN